MSVASMDYADSPLFPALPDDVVRVIAEPQRRAVLHGLDARVGGSDTDLERLGRLAASLFEDSAASINLIDVDRHRSIANFGVPGGNSQLLFHLSALTLAAPDGSLFVDDTHSDIRLQQFERESTIRSCVGAALVVNGAPIGALLVVSRRPQERIAPDVLARIKDIAALASSLLTLKDSSYRGDLAAAALTRVEKRHKLALEAATIASWVWDVKSGMVDCDPLLPELFDLPSATRLRARQLFFAIDPRDLRETAGALDTVIDSNDDYSGEYRIKGTSPPRWLSTRGRVIDRDESGRPILVIGVSYDISQRKSTEESQRLLLRELNHRVKNTLATVQALASQTVRHAHDPRAFLEAFSARLQSLGRAHSLLSDHEWRGISLEGLLRLQVKPFEDLREPRIKIAGPAVWLTPDQAVALGLVVHELGSNALRHGALSVARGSVDVSWQLAGGNGAPRVVLVWCERGGPPVSEPSRRGFGSILIRRSLDKILASEVKHEFLPDGVRAEISLPLDVQSF